MNVFSFIEAWYNFFFAKLYFISTKGFVSFRFSLFSALQPLRLGPSNAAERDFEKSKSFLADTTQKVLKFFVLNRDEDIIF